MFKDNITIKYVLGLKQFGINLLTGEACAYSIRGLYDLTEQGVRIMEAYLGGNLRIRRGSQMNPSIQHEDRPPVPTVASIMLSNSQIIDLINFIMWYEVGAYASYEYAPGNFISLTQEQFLELVSENTESGEVADLPDYIRERIRYNYDYNSDPYNSIDGRNVHQATGRVK